MSEFERKVIEVARRWSAGKASGVELDDAIRAMVLDGDEYVTLDDVLGRGRHEDESGVDLREPTR